MEGLLEPSIEAQASQLSWVLQVWQFEGHSVELGQVRGKLCLDGASQILPLNFLATYLYSRHLASRKAQDHRRNSFTRLLFLSGLSGPSR